MKLVNGIFALAAMIILVGCAPSGSVDMLNRAQPVGSPFTKYLAHEYGVLTNSLSGQQAGYFAKKGLAAVDGMIVEPETLDGKDLSGPDAADMAEARGELISMLENGARQQAPDQAAIAQTRFDCWADHQGTFPGDDVSCRDRLQIAMEALKQSASVAPPPSSLPQPEQFPSPITDGARGENVPVDQASLLVFFDWNKYVIGDSAKGVLDTVAQEIKSRSDIKKVVVIGHTDTSGSEKYNMKLSVKRANAVRAALISHGVPPSKIRTEGHGETDLLVKTAKGVREAKNRRAQITFE